MTAAPAPSLRARLALAHGLALAAVLVAFALAVYGLFARSLLAEVDRSLVERAEQVNRTVRLALPLRVHAVVIPPPDRFASADTFVQLVALDGTVIATSGNLGAASLPVAAADLRAVAAGQGRFSVARLDGERLRVFSAPLWVRGQVVAMVQVARSLERAERALARLRALAGTGLLLALGVSGLALWLAAGSALRPLAGLIATAEAIAASGDLDRRVPTPPSQDELGRLAAAFNRMLDRLAASRDELRAAQARLQAALEAQRRFVADASHSLRTPLTVIRGNADLLLQFPDLRPEDRDAALAQIRAEAERMARLVHRLLALARADAGEVLRRVPVRLDQVVAEVLDQTRRLARGRRIEAEGLDAVEVRGDPDALRELVAILLDNAVKYTPDGGRIAVRLEATAGEAVLTVSDTGVGIDPEDLPHIFERFYRADRARRTGGTGLGLAIARSIAERHGGTISATSAPGAGSTFTVRLPLGAGAAGTAPGSGGDG